MIGIFDSGIGGLTVARAIMNRIPNSDICYFGDTARTPYGTKSPETVTKYSIENTEFLLEKGARMVVIACNTASSVATSELRKRFDIPIFEVITPAVRMALAVKKVRRVGVIGTRATIGSGVYENKITTQNPDIRVYSAPCPLLVSLVEEGWLNKRETRMIVKKYLRPLKDRQIDALILGCTHYPVLQSLIQEKVGKRVTIVDSSAATALDLQNHLDNHPETAELLGKHGRFETFVSDVTPQFEKIARMILKKNVPLTHVPI